MSPIFVLCSGLPDLFQVGLFQFHDLLDQRDLGDVPLRQRNPKSLRVPKVVRRQRPGKEVEVSCRKVRDEGNRLPEETGDLGVGGRKVIFMGTLM